MKTQNIRNQKKTRRARKKSQLFHKSGMLLAVLLLFFCVSMISGGRFGRLQKVSAADSSLKYYKSIQIEQGDTLWGIADRYCDEHYDSKTDYIQEIKQMNHLSSDQIHADQYLTVVYYAEP